MTAANPYECCGACEAQPDHCRDVFCGCHDYIAVTDRPEHG